MVIEVKSACSACGEAFEEGDTVWMTAPDRYLCRACYRGLPGANESRVGPGSRPRHPPRWLCAACGGPWWIYVLAGVAVAKLAEALIVRYL